MKYWLPLEAKGKVKRSVPHDENERQWSVNDCWLCNMVNHSVMWPLLYIYIVLTVLVR